MLARLGVCVPLVLLGALALTGCGEPAQDSSSALRARAEPYFREFEEFDAWARRNFDADLALRDARALEETVFAPIRRERHILAAWVEREGADPRQVGLRTETALTFDWVELRGVPMLSRLSVAEASLADPRTPRAPPRDAVVLSRRASSARGGGDVRVTVAYAPRELDAEDDE
ncbi:MAG: hypothetical protein KC593_18535 [Myxococcales bacterium]|nr:hypothetical protein [Myxococcales bacterium]MCB9628332.1 hypothetical protein [Sandaracinaceae bacterium]